MLGRFPNPSTPPPPPRPCVYVQSERFQLLSTLPGGGWGARNDGTTKLLATGYRSPKHKFTLPTLFSYVFQKILVRIVVRPCGLNTVQTNLQLLSDKTQTSFQVTYPSACHQLSLRRRRWFHQRHSCGCDGFSGFQDLFFEVQWLVRFLERWKRKSIDGIQ